ncbi:MAG: DNA mismatch repair endonuclease MutL [Bacteroides sp.]|nr:DNA mismatch repair endonuclease MutL [Bacteroides sp.]
MKDVINLLPDSVANQIAAGEVIQRPSSVIKELVENSIDAGANNINVVVSESGRELIQVIDDGKGMSEVDARLAFERHATSKIRSASDLFSLTTMGFRGEALASIAAVAQVELKTKMQEDEVGTKVVIEGSKVIGQEYVSCPTGSNFMIKNLFFNVPARRKFLKSDSTELKNIITEFERIVLVNPNVSFSLNSNNTCVYNLPASTLRHRIADVFGKKLSQQLLEVEVDTSIIKIKGYIAKPEAARKKGYHQYFFINGRYMKHPYFHRAITDAYEHIIPVGEQISYFLYMEVEPSTIDVNIHPTKTEIKFENEQSIWQILSSTVKESLGKFSIMPSIDFDTADMPEIPPITNEQYFAPPKVHYNPDYNPFKSTSSSSYSRGGGGRDSSSNIDWESIYSNISRAKIEHQDEPYSDALDLPFNTDGGSKFNSDEDTQQSLYADDEMIKNANTNLHFKGKYILTSVKSGLMIIDQHRAHTRILYDMYLSHIKNNQGISQKVLFPEIVQLSSSEVAILESLEDDFTSLGFELTNLGGGSYSISAVPSGIGEINPVNVVKQMVADAVDKGSDVKEELQSELALTLARNSAIFYGRYLNAEEMQNILDKLFACTEPSYTPDGKTIISTIKEDEIEKLFK